MRGVDRRRSWFRFAERANEEFAGGSPRSLIGCTGRCQPLPIVLVAATSLPYAGCLSGGMSYVVFATRPLAADAGCCHLAHLVERATRGAGHRPCRARRSRGHRLVPARHARRHRDPRRGRQLRRDPEHGSAVQPGPGQADVGIGRRRRREQSRQLLSGRRGHDQPAQPRLALHDGRVQRSALSRAVLGQHRALQQHHVDSQRRGRQRRNAEGRRRGDLRRRRDRRRRQLRHAQGLRRPRAQRRLSLHRRFRRRLRHRRAVGHEPRRRRRAARLGELSASQRAERDRSRLDAAAHAGKPEQLAEPDVGHLEPRHGRIPAPGRRRADLVHTHTDARQPACR